MENTPSRIAADILITTLETKMLYANTPKEITDHFLAIHQAVFDAAKKDSDANLSAPFVK